MSFNYKYQLRSCINAAETRTKVIVFCLLR